MKKAEKQTVLDALKKVGFSERHVIFKKDGTVKTMSGYFYRGQGGTEESNKQKVLTAFPDAEIIQTGDQFTSFRGGAPLAKQSHVYVIFKLKSKES